LRPVSLVLDTLNAPVRSFLCRLTGADRHENRAWLAGREVGEGSFPAGDIPSITFEEEI